MVATTDYEATLSKAGLTDVKILILDPKSIKHNFDKQLIVINVPKQDPTPVTFVLDLKNLREVITIQGMLEDESGKSALEKKQDLRDMLRTAGTYSLIWDSRDNYQPYKGNVLKCEVSEEAGNTGDLNDTKSYGITLQFVIGTFKG